MKLLKEICQKIDDICQEILAYWPSDSPCFFLADSFFLQLCHCPAPSGYLRLEKVQRVSANVSFPMYLYYLPGPEVIYC